MPDHPDLVAELEKLDALGYDIGPWERAAADEITRLRAEVAEKEGVIESGVTLLVLAKQRMAALAEAQARLRNSIIGGQEAVAEVQRLQAALAEAQARAEGWRTKYHNDKTVWCDNAAEAQRDAEQHARDFITLKAQRCGTCADWDEADSIVRLHDSKVVARCASEESEDFENMHSADHACPHWRQREEGR